MLTGTLPQASQQNVFFGLPLRLMPEEARVLAETRAARVVKDRENHEKQLRLLEAGSPQQKQKKNEWMASLRALGERILQEQQSDKQGRTQKAKGRMGEEARVKREARAAERASKSQSAENAQQARTNDADAPSADVKLFDPDEPNTSQNVEKTTDSDPANVVTEEMSTPMSALRTSDELPSITPTISSPPFSTDQIDSEVDAGLPPVPSSYPLFKYLHQRGYFMSPGLRFGCQYMAYPGDPLRYHSHFMVIGREWEEEVDLLTLIGVGRLGTGVKKGVLIGGVEPDRTSDQSLLGAEADSSDGNVRCFCIEWGGM